MCTVSWLPEPGGFTLCFNRDERRTRGAALPPESRRAGGRAFLAPYDSDHGGTWLAVNDAGLALGLLYAWAMGWEGAPFETVVPALGAGFALAGLPFGFWIAR